MRKVHGSRPDTPLEYLPFWLFLALLLPCQSPGIENIRHGAWLCLPEKSGICCHGSPKFYHWSLTVPSPRRVIFFEIFIMFWSIWTDQGICKKMMLDSKWIEALLIGMKFPCENLIFFYWHFQESIPDNLRLPYEMTSSPIYSDLEMIPILGWYESLA